MNVSGFKHQYYYHYRHKKGKQGREIYEQLHMNELNNLKEMETLLQGHGLLKLKRKNRKHE